MTSFSLLKKIILSIEKEKKDDKEGGTYCPRIHIPMDENTAPGLTHICTHLYMGPQTGNSYEKIC